MAIRMVGFDAGQLNYYGFKKAERNTDRFVCSDKTIKGPWDFGRLHRFVPAHTAGRGGAAVRREPSPPPRQPKKRTAPTPRPAPQAKRVSAWRPRWYVGNDE